MLRAAPPGSRPRPPPPPAAAKPRPAPRARPARVAAALPQSDVPAPACDPARVRECWLHAARLADDSLDEDGTVFLACAQSPDVAPGLFLLGPDLLDGLAGLLALPGLSSRPLLHVLRAVLHAVSQPADAAALRSAAALSRHRSGLVVERLLALVRAYVGARGRHAVLAAEHIDCVLAMAPHLRRTKAWDEVLLNDLVPLVKRRPRAASLDLVVAALDAPHLSRLVADELLESLPVAEAVCRHLRGALVAGPAAKRAAQSLLDEHLALFVARGPVAQQVLTLGCLDFQLLPRLVSAFEMGALAVPDEAWWRHLCINIMLKSLLFFSVGGPRAARCRTQVVCCLLQQAVAGSADCSTALVRFLGDPTGFVAIPQIFEMADSVDCADPSAAKAIALDALRHVVATASDCPAPQLAQLAADLADLAAVPTNATAELKALCAALERAGAAAAPAPPSEPLGARPATARPRARTTSSSARYV